MKQISIIVAGSRDFADYQAVKTAVLQFVESSYSDCQITIVSGGSKGVDHLGERLADEMGWTKTIVKADWRLGRGAGPARNTQMAKMADALVAFWDGSSHGTADMIKKAEKAHLPVKTILIAPGTDS